MKLYGGALDIGDRSAVFDGANAAALQRPDGAWEVLQFANAELVGERTYELSRLLRGQIGSEWAMGDPLVAGAPFVLLDEHVIPIARGLDALGRPMQLRVVAAGRDHGDPARWRHRDPAGDRAAGRCRRCIFAPTRGDRRRRPLLGPPHAARRRVWEARRGAARRGERSLRARRARPARRSCARSTADDAVGALSAADEIADFGSAQTSLRLRVAQLSATVGRGLPPRPSHALRHHDRHRQSRPALASTAAQAQKHVTHNEALRILDTLVQLAVLDRDLTAPPGSPAEGERWIVKATGADRRLGRPRQRDRRLAGRRLAVPARRRPAGSPIVGRRGHAAGLERHRLGRLPRDRHVAPEPDAARRRHHGGCHQSVQRQAQQRAVDRQDRGRGRRRRPALQAQQGERGQDAVVAVAGQFFRPRRDRADRRRRLPFQGRRPTARPGTRASRSPRRPARCRFPSPAGRAKC